MSMSGSPDPQPSNSVKRGTKACVACRKGKNRCVNDGAPPCQRCSNSKTHCVFESPSTSKQTDEERMDRLEQTLNRLTSDVHQLVTVVRASHSTQPPHPPTLLPAGPAGIHLARLPPGWNAQSPSNPLAWHHDVTGSDPLGANSVPPPSLDSPYLQTAPAPPTFGPAPTRDIDGSVISNASTNTGVKRRIGDLDEISPSAAHAPHRKWPSLPNYPAPPHPLSTYGLVPSRAPSDDDEDALPSGSLTAPFEALAQAAAQASETRTAPGASGPSIPRVRNGLRARIVPPPPNAFPDVVEKELVDDATAREVFEFFIEKCLPFFPILDPASDLYESIRERSPWSLDSIIAVTAPRLVNPSPAIKSSINHALEEAQGIARSSLFGPTVRVEGCSAMGILSAWSDGYLSAGHALRMAEELNLHRALGQLCLERDHTKAGELTLVTSTRIWLCLSLLDYTLASSSGRPTRLHHELVSASKLDAFLNSKFSIDTDAFIVAQFELIDIRTRIEVNQMTDGVITPQLVDFARRTAKELKAWHIKWDSTLARTQKPDSIQRVRLTWSLNSNLVYLYTTLLKGQALVSAEALPIEAREFVLMARQSSSVILNTASPFRQAIGFATQDVLIEISFACLLYLKLSRLYPEGLDLYAVAKQCCDLYGWLSAYQALRRYSLTMRLAVERFGVSAGIASDVTALLQRADASQKSNLAASMPEISSLPMGFAPVTSSAQLSDLNWVGGEALPEWLQGGEDWILDPSSGIDRLFLPHWSASIEW